METKRTEFTKHYWNNEGAYESQFKTLTDTLVPATGKAEYLVGEVVRAANRLYYEYCNNGNINARYLKELEPEEYDCPCCNGSGVIDDEDCEECGGSGVCYGDPDYEVELSIFYGAFVNIIRDAFKKDGNTEGVKAMDAIENFILNQDPEQQDYFRDHHMHKYDLMVDLVTEYALKHYNDKTELPNDYKG